MLVIFFYSLPISLKQVLGGILIWLVALSCSGLILICIPPAFSGLVQVTAADALPGFPNSGATALADSAFPPEA